MGTGELLDQPNKMQGVTWHWTSIPPRGSSSTPSRLHAMEARISFGSVGQFGTERLYLLTTCTAYRNCQCVTNVRNNPVITSYR